MIDPFKVFDHGRERNKSRRLKEGQTPKRRA
jgi:hypothetical protein